MTPYQMQMLTPANFPGLHRAFCDAFRDYPASVNTGAEELRQRLARVGVSYALSVGAFYQGELVGFLLTAAGDYLGKPTFYNAGTGVVPAHRGHQLAKAMYRYLWNRPEAAQVSQFLLEVLVNNQPAIRVYRQLGFHINRTLCCFTYQKKDLPPPPKKLPLQLAKTDPMQADYLSVFGEQQPSWPNAIGCIMRNYPYEQLVEARLHGELVGLIAFIPEVGRISQIAVSPQFRRQGIGTQLVRAALAFSELPGLTIINIDHENAALCNFFRALGFFNPLDQYEMLLHRPIA